MTSREKEAWGAAPVAATAAFWACNGIAAAIQGRSIPFGGDPAAAIGTLFLFMLFGLPVAYLITFAVAYPAFLQLRRRDRLTRKAILIASAVVGTVVITAPAIFTATQQGFTLQPLIIAAVFGSASGVVGGIVFVRLYPFEPNPPPAHNPADG